MTYRILKSQTFPGFEAAVAAFAKEIRDWNDQEKIATEHDALADIPAIERYVHRKRPSADQRVMDAVNESNVADFEIVDDGPSPDQMLRQKKDKLLYAVAAAETAAMHLTLPPGKRRAFSLRQVDIDIADAKVRTDFNAKVKSDFNAKRKSDLKLSSVVKKIAVAVGLSDPPVQTDPPDVEDEVMKNRSSADTKFLSDQTDRQTKAVLVARASAQMQSDIEDLTLGNIDAWKMPDFPK